MSADRLKDPAAALFREARAVGRRSPRGVVLVWALAVVYVVVALSVSGGFAEISPVWIGGNVVVLAICIAATVRYVRSYGIWNRAARGQATLTVQGRVVPQRRVVSGREMRTVVVETLGTRYYLHALFVDGAAARLVADGPVTADLFAGSMVQGPARLTSPEGVVVWAFTARQGTTVGRPGQGPEGLVTYGADTTIEPAVPGGWKDPLAARDGDAVSHDSAEGGDGWQGGSAWGSDSVWSDSGRSSAGGGSGGGSGSSGDWDRGGSEPGASGGSASGGSSGGSD
ncbi:hypothetical protein [Antribacter gilvus]|uniref:hypothetical protein n=1 Tax=Antribacter gilvus TaxID=2304675 RepID=UPI000F7AE52A|nr:hypothetical protein [Antribacter gilvus]